MAIRPFLAMTAAEIRRKTVLPDKIAWMACHFSPYGLGLSNLPRTLPAGSLLILDDITPIRGHDPQIILEQLAETSETLSCSGILLDFQQPDVEETAALVKILTQSLPCPVAVSHFYAGSGSFPVFLPPVPPSELPEDYFATWAGRDIWLEVALDGEEITVTEKGTSFSPLPCPDLTAEGFREETLCCHYRCRKSEDNVKFLLWRTEEDMDALLKQSTQLGVTAAVGLYQEFSNSINCR